MERRHFEAVARGVATYSKAHSQRVIMPAVLAECIADEIKQFNSNFDRARFIEACSSEGK